MKDKEIKKQEEELAKQFSILLTKKEMIVLNNFILSQEFKIGDALIFLPILEKIRPFIQDTMQTTAPIKDKPNGVDIGRPKN